VLASNIIRILLMISNVELACTIYLISFFIRMAAFLILLKKKDAVCLQNIYLKRLILSLITLLKR
jgi:hypothetical protein